MTAGVYAIVNTANGMAYVGSSIDIEKRWAYHRSTLQRNAPWDSPRVLIRAWNDVAGEGFEWIILEETEPNEDTLEQTEQRWIDHYAGRLYNVRVQAKRMSRVRKLAAALSVEPSALIDEDRRTTGRGASSPEVD